MAQHSFSISGFQVIILGNLRLRRGSHLAGVQRWRDRSPYGNFQPLTIRKPVWVDARSASLNKCSANFTAYYPAAVALTCSLFVRLRHSINRRSNYPSWVHSLLQQFVDRKDLGAEIQLRSYDKAVHLRRYVQHQAQRALSFSASVGLRAISVDCQLKQDLKPVYFEIYFISYADLIPTKG